MGDQAKATVIPKFVGTVESTRGRRPFTGIARCYSMIHKPLMDNENFKSLTIVERSQEVIDLVWDHCHKDERFNIVHSDIYDYEPTQKFDIGWFDSWIGEEPGGSRAENYPHYSEIYEMDMKEKFGKHCTKLLFWKSIHSPKN